MEEHAKNTNRTCAEVLFDEWGTSGKVRPTLDTLMDILRQAEMIRAVEEIARMLGGSNQIVKYTLEFSEQLFNKKYMLQRRHHLDPEKAQQQPYQLT